MGLTRPSHQIGDKSPHSPALSLESLNLLDGDWLVVCTLSTSGDAVDAMKLGAVDYLEKPLEEQALMALLGKVAPPPAAVKPHALLESLTLREREILQIMAQGLSSKEVAKQLCISPRTVDVHRCNILSKLGVNSMLVAIRMLRLS